IHILRTRGDEADGEVVGVGALRSRGGRGGSPTAAFLVGDADGVVVGGMGEPDGQIFDRLDLFVVAVAGAVPLAEGVCRRGEVGEVVDRVDRHDAAVGAAADVDAAHIDVAVLLDVGVDEALEGGDVVLRADFVGIL